MKKGWIIAMVIIGIIAIGAGVWYYRKKQAEKTGSTDTQEKKNKQVSSQAKQ